MFEKVVVFAAEWVVSALVFAVEHIETVFPAIRVRHPLESSAGSLSVSSLLQSPLEDTAVAEIASEKISVGCSFVALHTSLGLPGRWMSHWVPFGSSAS